MPDYDNVYDLARRATKAVEDNTGTLDYPGAYVRAELNLHCCQFRVLHGWRGSGRQEIAGFFTDEVTKQGRIFMMLVGSISNYIGRSPEPPGRGWFPSDLYGLYDILDNALERTDDEVTREAWVDDHDLDDAARFGVAIRVAGHMSQRFPARRLEVLAQVHHHQQSAVVRNKRFRSLVLGAPIWIVTPSPSRLAGLELS
jgi:hypothetical protein